MSAEPGMPDSPTSVVLAVQQLLTLILILGAVMSHASDPPKPEPRNRLADEKSPYLLQHAANPVDWYPWGEEAFEKARTENKPIFLSIGYATCHWCHVMERESFENPEIAALMNSAFVNIKVDREERPDIDQVYMTVCQMLTGSGGWPLTIIMTPDRRPFFAATYLPPDTRFGRMGMRELVPKIVELWTSQRDRVDGSAEQVTARLAAMAQPRAGATADTALPDRAVRELEARYDAAHGGFGSAPKFPSPHNLMLLARYSVLGNHPSGLAMADHTLREMRSGGIFDQIGYGFHRYSTDAEWLVPHFEKMLYDQAMLMLAATEVVAAGGDERHRTTVADIATYVLRDMTSPEGAFYSAEDADSEGGEGTFYLWTTDELTSVLGDDDGRFAAQVFNAVPQGNFAEESTGERTGRNILHLGRDDVATRTGADAAAVSNRLDRVRTKLFEHRTKRVHPLKDDKLLADWNGLMAAALARAGRFFNEPRYVRAAARAVDFVLETMVEDGRLHHRWRDGHLSVPAFLDDHVFVIWALLELYDATLDPDRLATALQLQARTDELFRDTENGGYFFSATDGERLLVRQKEVYDGAIPSGNSVAAHNLIRLSRLTGVEAFAEQAGSIFSAFAADTGRSASAHSHLAEAMLSARSPSIEIVIAGRSGDSDTEALLHQVRTRSLPNAAMVLVEPGPAGDVIRTLAPFTEHHTPIDGAAAAYVCRDHACKAPTTVPEELGRLLDEATGTTSD